MAGNRISIVIPTRNRAHLLRSTLICVRSQTWAEKEVVVVDEASSDGTAAMLMNDFPDVKVVRNETPRGPGAARNIGIRHTTGDWLFFWDDDDLMHPAHLEALLQATLAAPPNALVSGRARAFAVIDGKVMLSPVICAPEERSDQATLSEFFEPSAQRSITHSTILWPRCLFDTVQWDEQLLFYEDFDVCGQAILAGRHIVGREVGMYYIRMHTGPRVTTGMSAQRFLSPAMYRLKWSDLLKGRGEFEDCAPAMRNGLMELIIELSGLGVARPIMPRLKAAFREWGGGRFYVTNPPLGRFKRTVAEAALLLAGPASIRWMRKAINRLRPPPTSYVATMTTAATAADLIDAASISLFL
ncbi:MAG TPA: glycosyltransferase [Reyranella sp.]|nr:glycosyltransferase [Reyranella sp.]